MNARSQALHRMVAGPAPCHDARDLTGESGTATIVLDGVAYTLRITRLGKLILTK